MGHQWSRSWRLSETDHSTICRSREETQATDFLYAAPFAADGPLASRLPSNRELSDAKVIELFKNALSEESTQRKSIPDPFEHISGNESEADLLGTLGQDKFEYLLQVSSFSFLFNS